MTPANRTALRRRLTAAIVAAACLSATAPLASAAPPPGGPVTVGFIEIDTIGAYGNARAVIDYGISVTVYVKDTKADGQCAHAAVRWLHENGNYYYDYGTYVCGVGKSVLRTLGTRDWTKYQSADLTVWSDGNSGYTRPLWHS